MAGETNQPFEDPALKAAVNRAWGKETASDSLRRRVLAEMPSGASTRRSFWQSRTPLIGLAAAAVVLVAFGIVAFFYLGNGSSSSGSNPYRVPSYFASAMIRRHAEQAARFVAAPSTNLPNSDLSALSRRLTSELGFAVIAAIEGDGWDYRESNVTQVEGTRVAQVVYTRKDQSISLFSIPATAPSPAATEGMTYRQFTDKTPIAGYVKNGVMYCMVGNNIELDDLKKMTDALMNAHASAPTR